MTENSTVRDKPAFVYLFIYVSPHTRPIHGSFDSEHNRLPLQTGAPAFMRVRASMHSTSGSVRITFYFRSKANTSRPQMSSTVWDETLAGISQLNAVNMDVVLNLYA